MSLRLNAEKAGKVPSDGMEHKMEVFGLMMNSRYRQSLLTTVCLGLFLTGGMVSDVLADSTPSKKAGSARNRFYKKYHKKLTPRDTNIPDPAREKNLRERGRKLREQHQELDLQKEEKVKVRKEKISRQKEVLEGKAAAIDKKEAENQKARREAILKRSEKEKIEEKKRIDRRHEEVVTRARKHRLENENQLDETERRRLEREVERSIHRQSSKPVAPSIGIGDMDPAIAPRRNPVPGEAVMPSVGVVPGNSQHLSGGVSPRPGTPRQHISGN